MNCNFSARISAFYTYNIYYRFKQYLDNVGKFRWNFMAFKGNLLRSIIVAVELHSWGYTYTQCMVFFHDAVGIIDFEILVALKCVRYNMY